MGSVILGIFLGGILLFIGFDNDLEDCIFFGILVILIGLFIGIMVPLGSYEEEYEVVSTTELIGIESDEKVIYVTFNGHDSSYTYYAEKYYEVDGIMQGVPEPFTISGNVEVNQEDIYTDGKLVVYLRKWKESWWSTCNKEDLLEYVFYLPTGTAILN